MSKYFQALNRISQQSKTVAEPPAEEKPAQKRQTPARASAADPPIVHETLLGDLPSAKRDLAYSSLLDSLRAVPSDTKVPCVVLAGVSRRSPSRRVLKGLLTQAENQAIRLLTLEMAFDGGRRHLKEMSLETLEQSQQILLPGQSNSDDSPRFTQRSTASGSQVEQWLQRIDSEFDLALIQAPPLRDSVEAALLARETDGLMLIAENLVDSHVDLVKATEKARDAGCALRGVVLVGSKEWLPSWLGRLFKGRGQTANGNK